MFIVAKCLFSGKTSMVVFETAKVLPSKIYPYMVYDKDKNLSLGHCKIQPVNLLTGPILTFTASGHLPET